MLRFYRLNTFGNRNGDLCSVDRFVEGVNHKSHLIVMGKRIGSEYPDDAVIRIGHDRPGIRLAPLIGNNEGMLMVSTAVVEIIKNHTQGVDVEYLPFTLLDPRGRVHSKDYWVVNPLVRVDCLDHVKSGTRFAQSDPSAVVGVPRWVFDPAKTAVAPQLFRVEGIHGEYVIGYDIAVELKGMENIYWEKIPFSNEV